MPTLPVDGTYRISSWKEPTYCLERITGKTDWTNNHVVFRKTDKANVAQLWNIYQDSNGGYKISNCSGEAVLLTYDSRRTVLYALSGWKAVYWVIEIVENKFLQAYPKELGTDHVIDSSGTGWMFAEMRKSNHDQSEKWQHLTFERVDSPPGPTNPIPSSASGYQEKFFTLTLDQVQKEVYDIIIVGAGAGGGVLAGDLYETNRKLGKYAKNILVIERGGLPFHSHTLNSSRPQDTTNGRNQANDFFFAQFKDTYTLDPSPQTDDKLRNEWAGGPVYGLGGRSTVWSLAAPRVHDDTLSKYFDPAVHTDLLKTYYKEAEDLMKIFLPKTQPEHQHLIDRLNMSADPVQGVQWEWARIASEFRDDKNFDFAKGAFSSLDKLLEIAMSKTVAPAGATDNFKILLGTEVRKVAFDSSGKTAVGVVVGPSSAPVTIKLAPKGKVVMSAGSVHSPSILMRSGVDVKGMGGCRLTDHDMIFKAQSFRYRDPAQREKLGSIKTQTYVKLPRDDVVLASLCLDSTSFLPRSYLPKDDLPHFILVFITRAPLSPDNSISLANEEPSVTIARAPTSLVYPLTGDTLAPDLVAKWAPLKQFALDAMKTVEDVMELDFVPLPPNTPFDGFGWTKLGGVAHEVGSLPMKGPETARNKKWCVDENLLLHGYSNVYVCDNSIHPVCPEVNPTLTLVALALRLSRTAISPLDHVKEIGGDVLQVANYTGSPIKVWASRRCGAVTTSGGTAEESQLVRVEPGESTQWNRDHNLDEAVFVYKLDLARTPTSKSQEEFLLVPELHVGYPGHVLRVEM